MSSDYRTITTPTPPVLRERDGGWFIVVIAANLEIEAPVGPWFAHEFLSRVVAPLVPTPKDQYHAKDNQAAPVPPDEP